MNEQTNSEKRNEENTNNSVLSKLKEITDTNRLDFYPKYFPIIFPKIEEALYQAMQNLTQEYDGGYWNFYTFTGNNGKEIPVVLWDANPDIEIHIESPGFQETYTTSPLVASFTIWTMIINQALWHTKDIMLHDYWCELSNFAYSTFTKDDQVVFHNVLD